MGQERPLGWGHKKCPMAVSQFCCITGMQPGERGTRNCTEGKAAPLSDKGSFGGAPKGEGTCSQEQPCKQRLRKEEKME